MTLFSGTEQHGQVTVDTSGTVTITVTAAAANTALPLQFCPFPEGRYSCFPLGSLTTDGTGAGQTSFPFPKSGSWAGDFHVGPLDTEARNDAGQDYLATLQPDKATNGESTRRAAPAPSAQQDPGTGTLSVNGTMHVTLTGAPPNTDYLVIQCFASDGSSCYQLGPNSEGKISFTTDSSGKGSFDAPTSGLPGDFFTVMRSETFSTSNAPPFGFAAGFKVP